MLLDPISRRLPGGIGSWPYRVKPLGQCPAHGGGSVEGPSHSSPSSIVKTAHGANELMSPPRSLDPHFVYLLRKHWGLRENSLMLSKALSRYRLPSISIVVVTICDPRCFPFILELLLSLRNFHFYAPYCDYHCWHGRATIALRFTLPQLSSERFHDRSHLYSWRYLGYRRPWYCCVAIFVFSLALQVLPWL